MPALLSNTNRESGSPEMTDAQLMELVKKNQLIYLREIFDRYSGKLYNYFRHMTGDADLSEDLTQNVFEKLIRSRHTYNEQGTFQGWLFRIAKNSLSEYFRTVKNNRYVQLEGVDIIQEPEQDNSDETLENKQRLNLAISKLKKEHKEIILLTRFENLSYKEVAGIIGISETGVKARVFRAMKSLKKAYFQNASTK